MLACRLILILVVACAAGCGGTLYQLRRVASRENSCPLDKIESLYCKNDVGMLNVCGTYRRYNYQGLHAEGRLDIYGVTGWGERLTDPSTYRHHLVQRTYDHWDGKRWTERRWPVWPCNQPRGKVDPQPLQVRPLTSP